MSLAADVANTAASPDRLTAALERSLSQPAISAGFDLHGQVDAVLADVGMHWQDCGGKLSFFGQDPILPSRIRFGSMAAIGLAAKAVAAAALWQQRGGEAQDIAIDVRKALRRFAGFFEGQWELLNGRGPAAGADEDNPFFKLPFFHETKDGRHVLPLNVYPRLRTRALNFLGCTDSNEAVRQAIRQWNGVELEAAAAEQGLVMGMVRSNEELRREAQYTQVLSRLPLIRVEKIGESEPMPFRSGGKTPLDGIRAFGMGHVIAGAGIGRDLAQFGADVLNIWRPNDTEKDAFFLDVQVGMRSTVLGDAPEDRKVFDQLLRDADIFFANKRPGFLPTHGLDAETLCAKRPGLIHVTVVLHGDEGPWANRPGFDEIGAAVSGLFALEGTLTQPRQPPIVPICDNVVGWLGTAGVLAALRRRAIEGGSYRVVVSLTRTVLWQLSLGIFDQDYARATAGSTEEHQYATPDLFVAQTPLGNYQGLTDQVRYSTIRESFRTVLEPRGASKPEWMNA